MARSTGYSCDRCGQFQAEEGGALPAGWIKLTVSLGGAKVGGNNELEICSNKCLAELAKERMKADRDTGSPDVRPGRAEGALRGTLTRWHREGKHDGDPKANCPLCELETAPQL